MGGPGSRVADGTTTTAAIIGEAKILGQIADDIIAGKFDSWDEAQREWNRQYTEMLRKAGGFTSLHTTMVPAEQTK